MKTDFNRRTALILNNLFYNRDTQIIQNAVNAVYEYSTSAREL